MGYQGELMLGYGVHPETFGGRMYGEVKVGGLRFLLKVIGCPVSCVGSGAWGEFHRLSQLLSLKDSCSLSTCHGSGQKVYQIS